MAITLELKPEVEERLRLRAKALGLLPEDYMQTLLEADATASGSSENPHSLLELAGAGAQLWNGVDAQDYVNSLRDEWDDCP